MTDFLEIPKNKQDVARIAQHFKGGRPDVGFWPSGSQYGLRAALITQHAWPSKKGPSPCYPISSWIVNECQLATEFRGLMMRPKIWELRKRLSSVIAACAPITVPVLGERRHAFHWWDGVELPEVPYVPTQIDITAEFTRQLSVAADSDGMAIQRFVTQLESQDLLGQAIGKKKMGVSREVHDAITVLIKVRTVYATCDWIDRLLL